MQSLPDMNELMKLAASPAGQKLIAMLQQDSSIDMKKLAQTASSGDYAGAKQQLNHILESEHIHALLKQLEHGYE